MFPRHSIWPLLSGMAMVGLTVTLVQPPNSRLSAPARAVLAASLLHPRSTVARTGRAARCAIARRERDGGRDPLRQAPCPHRPCRCTARVIAGWAARVLHGGGAAEDCDLGPPLRDRHVRPRSSPQVRSRFQLASSPQKPRICRVCSGRMEKSKTQLLATTWSSSAWTHSAEIVWSRLRGQGIGRAVQAKQCAIAGAGQNCAVLAAEGAGPARRLVPLCE